MRLARRDDADLGLCGRNDIAINTIDARKSCHRGEFGRQAAFNFERGKIRPADVKAVGVRFQATLLSNCFAVEPARNPAIDQIQVDRCTAFNHF